MASNDVSLDIVFKALADPVRRQILTALSKGPATIGKLAEPLDMSFAGAAKHVNILVDARLIRKSRNGRQQICRLEIMPMQNARNWLDRHTTF